MNIKRVTFISSLGTLLEMYDYSLYGYMALIFGKVFFPAANNSLTLIYTFVVFAAGFLMRPLAAIILGNLGDTAGRKKTLVVTIFLMALSISGIGFLPGYAVIGISAPLLLLVFRLLQGFSVSGELSLATIYISEHVLQNQRGYAISFVLVGSVLGLIFSIVIGQVLLQLLSPKALNSWGWRVPFILGIFVGLLGFYLRRRSEESPEYLAVLQENRIHRTPILRALRSHYCAMLLLVGLAGFNNAIFYLFFVYIPTYLVSLSKESLATALSITGVGMVVYAIFLPIFGKLSDRIGQKGLLFISILLIGAAVYPCFVILLKGTILFKIIAEIFLSILAAAYIAPLFPIMLDFFPTEIRASGVTFSFNIAVTLFGGTAPLIATLLISLTHNPFSPSFYVIACGLIALTACFKLKIIMFSRVVIKQV